MNSRAAAILSERSRFTPGARTLAATLGLGVILAVIAIAQWSSALPVSQVTMESSRQTLIANSISVLDQGGPPLTGSTVPYKQGLANPTASFFAANQGDDEGIYLYLPVAGHLLGISDPRQLLRWMFFLCMALVVLLYPTIFYALTGSRTAAIVAPLAVILGFGFLLNTDIYWVPAWAALLGLPLVYLAARGRWRRRQGLLLLVAAALVASFTTSIRAHGGTGIAVAALVVVLLRETSWRSKIAGGAAVVIAYLSIATFGLAAVHAYRDHVVQIAPSALPNTHPFWHPAYLGLGYLPNKWGIRWDDAVAFHAAQRVDPSVQYLTPHYESILRGLYLKILRVDPGFVAHVYAVKAAIVLRAAFERFGWALLLLPFLLAYGRRRRSLRFEIALAVPALALAIAPPILTVPQTYDVGFLGTCGLVALMVLASGFAALSTRRVPSASELEAMFNDTPVTELLARLQARLRTLHPRERPLRPALVGAVLAVALIVSAAAYASANGSAVFYGSRSWYRQPAPPTVAKLEEWTGPNALDNWDVSTGVSITPSGDGVVVTSSAQSGSTVIESPAGALAPGSYAVVVDGTVAAGGIQVGIWSVAHDAWDAERLYASAASRDVSGAIVVPVTVNQDDDVQIRLVNWSPNSKPSTTDIISVKLVRIPPTAVSG